MFAVRFPDGTFLSRKVNPIGHRKRRRRVTLLEEATLWAKRGHAKTALVAAVLAGELRSGAKATIIRVDVWIIGGFDEPVVVRTRDHRTTVEPRKP